MAESGGFRALFRDEVFRLAPYLPGKPVEEVERELGIAEALKLASNENCLGASPLALEAGRAALTRGVHLYPDGGSHYLRQRLAAIHRLPSSSIFVGNGTTEIIQLLTQVLLGPGRSAVFSENAFIMYPLAVSISGGESLAAPMDGSLRHDLDAMASLVRPDTRLAIVANPNNPTGTYVDRPALDRFLARLPGHVLAVVDEAYKEYVEREDYPDAADDLRAGRPVVALRTFSKIHGLAGMRIGYALAPPEVVDALNRVRSPFNVTGLSQAMALAALGDAEHVRRSREHNRRELDYLAAELGRRRIAFTPSVANFVLVEVGDPAEAVYARLLAQGIITRPMSAYGFPTRLRISIGTRPENERMLLALDRVQEGHGEGPDRR